MFLYVLITQVDLRSEFDQLLLPYTEDSGVTEEDVDAELAEALGQMARLREKGRNSKSLQRKIQDLKRLVELRALMVAKIATEAHLRMQELQSEFDQLLLPYVKDWGVTQDDIDEELAEALGKMARLRKKGRSSKVLLQKIKDFERLVELRDRLIVRHAFATSKREEKFGSECNQLSRTYTRVLGARAEAMPVLRTQKLLSPYTILVRSQESILIAIM